MNSSLHFCKVNNQLGTIFKKLLFLYGLITQWDRSLDEGKGLKMAPSSKASNFLIFISYSFMFLSALAIDYCD